MSYEAKIFLNSMQPGLKKQVMEKKLYQISQERVIMASIAFCVVLSLPQPKANTALSLFKPNPKTRRENVK